MCITRFLKSLQTYQYKKLRINNRIVKVRVADTFLKKMLGLMYEKDIKNNEGMLFVFDHETNAPIWMRNMLFPIDAIWLDSNLNVVHIERNIKPQSGFDFRTYGGKASAKYIVELPSGFLKNLNKKIKIEIIN